VLQVQQRVEELQGELAARQAGPQLRLPDGTACALSGDACPNPLEVQLGCGNGNFMCRSCYGVACRHHTEMGAEDFPCPLCCKPCALPAQ
jgi:hypothetical protein